jgi:glycosyltransferase A (GT-A) superfamily protein (DUF2064 family)
VPFRAILETLLIEHAPRMRGAIFCDDEGERVDAARVDELGAYDLDLLGAAYAPVAAALGADACLRITHEGQVLWIATVSGGYYLLAVCTARASGSVRDELPRAVAALAAHM